jgi:hypothetical protein
MGLCLAADYSLAQPPGGRPDGGGQGGFGPGGGRGNRGGGFGGRGFGFGEASFTFELRRNESFAKKVNLTEDQKQQINELDMEKRELYRSAFQPGPGAEEAQAKIKEIDNKILALLTAEQKVVWEERKTELKAEAEARGQVGDRPAPGGERPAGDRPRSDGGSSTQGPPRRTVFSDEKPPEGTTATASFSSRATAAATGDSPAGAGGADARNGDVTLSFNFRYAPWADVLKLFAEAAGLTLDLNDVPPGTFNYYDEKTYTVTEALDVLNGYLLPKGYVLIRRDRFLVSLNIDPGIHPALLPTITVDDLPKRGQNELLIVDVPLE